MKNSRIETESSQPVVHWIDKLNSIALWMITPMLFSLKPS